MGLQHFDCNSAFCLRHNLRYDGRSTWTTAHIKWLRGLEPEGLYQEILEEYLLTLSTLMDKIERLDRRIEELSRRREYHEKTKQLTCFLGLVPGEDSSGDSRTRLGITKAGNCPALYGG